jgi:prevent-host-death family protein
MAKPRNAKAAGQKRGQPRQQVMGATEAQNNFGRVLDLAQAGPVVVEKFGRPTAVVISTALYESLTANDRMEGDLEALASRFDAMVSGMQSDRAGDAVDSLFAAAGRDLGEAALRSARKRSKPASSG